MVTKKEGTIAPTNEFSMLSAIHSNPFHQT